MPDSLVEGVPSAGGKALVCYLLGSVCESGYGGAAGELLVCVSWSSIGYESI